MLSIDCIEKDISVSVISLLCATVCQLGDSSHIKDDDDCLKSLVAEEVNRDSFTAVVITGINITHINYLRTQVKQWTRQLASVSPYLSCLVSGKILQLVLDCNLFLNVLLSFWLSFSGPPLTLTPFVELNLDQTFCLLAFSVVDFFYILMFLVTFE